MSRSLDVLRLVAVVAPLVALPVLAAHCTAADSCPLTPAAAAAPCHAPAGDADQAPVPDCCDPSQSEAPASSRVPLPAAAQGWATARPPAPAKAAAADRLGSERDRWRTAPTPPLALRV